MPAINKEIKNKNSMLKMQVTAEQRVFVVKTYYKTSRYLEVKEAIHRRFSERGPAANRTIWTNAMKYKRKGASLNSLNINKGRCDRKRTDRTKETMEVVRFKEV